MLERDPTIRISTIIPVGSRHSDLKELYAEYANGLGALGVKYECIFVLDGPRPEAQKALAELMEHGEAITVVSLTRSFGEATALMAGFEQASGELLITLPAYHQIEPVEIPKLVAALDAADVAIGHRHPRIGGVFEKLRRSAFHDLLGWVTGLKVRDLGCGARAMKRQVLEEIALYGDQHRFLAVLADRQGFRIKEVDVKQSSKDRFKGIYPPKEYAHGILDILTVFFLVRFTKKPLRFFGMIGASLFVVGALLTCYLVFGRMFLGEALADRPALLLSSLLVVLGLQIFALGLLGELIIFTHARHIKDYQVARVIGGEQAIISSETSGSPKIVRL